MTMSRTLVVFIAATLGWAAPTRAEVVGVTIATRTPVADGRAFGSRGAYEQLTGRIEFAIDPADPHNRGIVDLEYAPRQTDGRVHFSADLFVLQPTDTAKGNGVLLFEVANRGNKELAGMFNRDAGDPAVGGGLGDGWLMREGYTIVWVGWQADLPDSASRDGGRLLRLSAPGPALPSNPPIQPVSVDIIVNEARAESVLTDSPSRPPVRYQPAEMASAGDTLTVRDRFWDQGRVIPRDTWRFVVTGDGVPVVHLDSNFEPGRWYRVSYQAASPVVSGVGLAALRDAASAFRYRTDLPVHGRLTYVYGNSQTGRFLRQFLYDGFNADEAGRRAFDALWAHIAGAARSNVNQRFATLSHGDMFEPTRFPFSDAEEMDADGTRDGLQLRYRPEQRPKVFYTNTPVEYWGGGRAAALTHTSPDGTRDLTVPDNVRIYLLSGAQHLPFPFPPDRRVVPGPNGNNSGQQLPNSLPQKDIMRALLRALHQWAADGVAPPPSQYPHLRDRTLTPVQQVKFPALPGVKDPKGIVGPGRMIRGTFVPLPFLVPQVDADGNEIAGIRDPEMAVPLATFTGWNFRAPRVGNSDDIYQILGSYIPFARTRAELTPGDSRLPIDERYRGLDDYMRRITRATDDLIRRRFLLAEDREPVLTRARAHWMFAASRQ